MRELLDEQEDEAVAHKRREMAEFMYAFEGAMSVIQETDEPDEDLTMKNSQ